MIVVTDEEAGKRFKDLYRGSAEVLVGEGALSTAACGNQVDLVLVSVVGIDGLKPTLDAIAAGKEIALANKETLVTGGELVMRAAKEKGILIRPVDSEHSAIFQSMLGQDKKQFIRYCLPHRADRSEDIQGNNWHKSRWRMP